MGRKYDYWLTEKAKAEVNGKPTEITASQWGQVAEDVAAGRCVVTNPLYSHEITNIEAIKPNSAGWDVAITDAKSTYRTWSDVKLTVTWLPATPPAPPAEDGAGVVRDADMPALMALIEKGLRKSGDGEAFVAVLELQTRYEALQSQFAAATARAAKAEAALNAAIKATESQRKQKLAYCEALEKIASKSDAERPEKLDGEDPFSFGITRGLWRAGVIAREALAAAMAEGEGAGDTKSDPNLDARARYFNALLRIQRYDDTNDFDAGDGLRNVKDIARKALEQDAAAI